MEEQKRRKDSEEKQHQEDSQQKKNDIKLDEAVVNFDDSSVRPSSSSYVTAEDNGFHGIISPTMEHKSTQELYCHINELENKLAEKDKKMGKLVKELEAIRERELSYVDSSVGPLTIDIETEYRAHLEDCHKKVQDFTNAVKQRDAIIDNLKKSLDDSIKERGLIQDKANQLTLEVQKLCSQMRQTNELHQQSSASMENAFKAQQVRLEENYQVKVKQKEESFRAQYDKGLKSVEDELSNCRNAKLELESEIRDLRLQCDNFNLKLSNQSSAHEEQILFFKNEINKLVNFSDVSNSLGKSQKAVQTLGTFELTQEIEAVARKLEELRSMNLELKKGKEEVEENFGALQKQHSEKVNYYESSLKSLEERLQSKEEEILDLQKKQSEMFSKDQVEILNRKIKHLVKDKNSLEEELIKCRKTYEKEIDSQKECIETLRKQTVSSKQTEIEGIQLILKECKLLLVSLEDFYQSDVLEKYAIGIEPLDTHTEKAASESELSRKMTDLENSNYRLLSKLKSSEIAGKEALQTMFRLVEESLRSLEVDGQNKESVLGAQLVKNVVRMEELQLQLKEMNVQCDSLKCNNENLQSDNGKLRLLNLRLEQNLNEVSKNVSQSNLKGSKIVPCVGSLPDSGWIQKCDQLEKENVQLNSEVQDLKDKLEEANVLLNLSSSRQSKQSDTSIPRKEVHSEGSVKEKENIMAFKREQSSLKTLFEEMQKDIFSEDNIKRIRQDVLQVMPDSEGTLKSNVFDIIVDNNLKRKQVILLQHELKAEKLALQFAEQDNDKISEKLENVRALLDKAWHECAVVESDLHMALKEVAILQMRVKRLERSKKTLCNRKSWTEQEVWKMIEEIAGQINNLSAQPHDGNVSTISSKVSSALKMNKKIITENEALLAKLQNGNVGAAKDIINSLQSDGLNLRRLLAGLQETEELINTKSGPALQLHVDILQQQLDEKSSLYQEACEAQFALEAELREQEEKERLQEESWLKDLKKLKIENQHLQLQANIGQIYQNTQKIFKPALEMKSLIEELESAHVQSVSLVQDEFERQVSLEKSRISAETAKDIANLERNHKEKLETFKTLSPSKDSLKIMQAIQEQESAVIRSQCEYHRLQDLFNLKVKLQSSSARKDWRSIILGRDQNWAFSLFKQQVGMDYMNAVQNNIMYWSDQWKECVTSLQSKLQTFDLDVDDELRKSEPPDNIDFVIKEMGVIKEKVVDTYTDCFNKLQNALEEQHNQLMNHLNNLVGQLEDSNNLLRLQDELNQVKSIHRSQLESIALQRNIEKSHTPQCCENHEQSLNSLRQQLEEKHNRQMEELRTYFEQKCADFEKHYSEEIFSQHSRKMSDCSSASESELASEMYYSGSGPPPNNGEIQRLTSLTFPDNFGDISFKELEEPVRTDHREQLEVLKLAQESQFQAQLETQREEYQIRLEELTRNMTERHFAELSLHTRRLEELQESEQVLKQQVGEAATEILSLKDRLKSEHEKNTVLDNKVVELESQLKAKQELYSSALQRLRVLEEEIATQQLSEDHVQQSLENVVSEMQPSESNSEALLQEKIKRMSDALKKINTDNSEQIATLKTKLRQKNDLLSKFEKDLSNMKAQHEAELDLLNKSIEKKLEQTVATFKQKQYEYEQHCTELQNQLKTKDVETDNRLAMLQSRLQEQETKLEEKNTLITQLEEKHQIALKERETEASQNLTQQKKDLEKEYEEYLEFVKKCADETKEKLVERYEKERNELRAEHNHELEKLRSKYESELASLGKNKTQRHAASQDVFLVKDVLKDALDALTDKQIDKVQKIFEELEAHHQRQLKVSESTLNKKLATLQQEANVKEDELRREQEIQLDTVRKECEQRYRIQLEEARADIVCALEHHIQELLDDTNAEERPPELQQLEDKLAAKYRRQLDSLQKDHDDQVLKLKKDHLSELDKLNKQLETIEVPLITNDQLNKLYRERDCLRNVAATLRDLVAELARYFVSCEDELNNTLVDELMRLEAERDHSLFCQTPSPELLLDSAKDIHEKRAATPENNKSTEEMSLIVATPASVRKSSTLNIKRVHFAPNISGILTFIDDESILESVGAGLCGRPRDVSLNFHQELDRCLERLREEAAALLKLSQPQTPHALPSTSAKVTLDEVTQLRAQLAVAQESKEHISNRLATARRNIKELEQVNEELQAKVDALQQEQDSLLEELKSARRKLASLERETQASSEVIAEGYGEGAASLHSGNFPNNPGAVNLEELQSKARSLLLGMGDSALSGVISPTSGQSLPHVVEELCRDWEKIADEARRRHEDLEQQVESADKQLRSTRAFLEEQALEREQERDEFLREIKQLQDRIRTSDRNYSTHEHMNSELDALDVQLKEAQTALEDTKEKRDHLEVERNNAVEKIYVLREIISELEEQLATKAQENDILQNQNETLQKMLEQQGRTQLELTQEMEALQFGPGLAEHINHLEEQLRKHQIQVEQLTNPTLLQQMKLQLRELETNLDTRTKELESAEAVSGAPASPCLSSPSEDVSIRDVVRAVLAKSDNSEEAASPVCLPLEEISRLQDQMQRHSRAEDAVLKRIRDLDMQLENVQTERNALQARVNELLLQISTLQARLEEQRCKVETRQTQATAEFQSRMQIVCDEKRALQEKLGSCEEQVKSLESALKQAQTKLKEKITEERRNFDDERRTVTQLEHQLARLSADKEKLQNMLRKQLQSIALPELLDKLLADKNADISRLEKQVSQLTQQVEQSSDYIASPNSTVEFVYREEDKLRGHVELSPILELRTSNNSTLQPEMCSKESPKPLQITLESLPRAESIMIERTLPSFQSTLFEESIGSQSFGQSASSSVKNSESINHDNAKCGKLNGISEDEEELENCRRKISELEEQLQRKSQEVDQYKVECKKALDGLEEKTNLLSNCEERLAEMDKLEIELEKLKNDYQESVSSVNKDKQFLEDKLNAKELEIARLTDEVKDTQSILGNLQRKLQEAKQLARSPINRSDDKLTLRKAQQDLEAALKEIDILRDMSKKVHLEEENVSQQKIGELENVISNKEQELLVLQEKYQFLEEEKARLQQEQEHYQDRSKDKDNTVLRLQNEISQLNMECVTLKQRLNMPVNEVSKLTQKLEAEKMFADALKGELSLLKNKNSELETENTTLSKLLQEVKSSISNDQLTALSEENKKLLWTIDKLEKTLEQLESETEHLRHKTAILKEENSEVGKELSDLKLVVSNKDSLDSTRVALEKEIHLKEKLCLRIKEEKESLTSELTALRNALQFIEDGTYDLSRICVSDVQLLSQIRNKLLTRKTLGKRGAPLHSKLSKSVVDVFEVGSKNDRFTELENLDSLTGLVQRELDESDHLDHTLLQTLTPLRKSVKSREGSSSRATKESHGELHAELQLLNNELNKRQEMMAQLETELTRERETVQLLHSKLREERTRYQSLQQQDSDLLEEMRRKLEEALTSQRKYEKSQQLNTMNEYNSNVERKLVLENGNQVKTQELNSDDDTKLVPLLAELEKKKIELDQAEKRLRRLQEAEVRRSRRRATAEEQSRLMIEQLRSTLAKTQKEMAGLRSQLVTASQELQQAHQELANERESRIRGHGPFLEKLKHMNAFLQEHIEESERMQKQTEAFTEEHRQLRARIVELEQQLTNRTGTDGWEARALYEAERAMWEQERTALHLALSEAKKTRSRAPDEQTEDRVNHLFGRYLRSESYRKSLAWQKRYLLLILENYSESCNLASKHLARFRYVDRKSPKPRRRFKSVVIVVMAVHRMSFLVDRWLRGKRVGTQVVLNQVYNHVEFTSHFSNNRGQNQPTSSVPNQYAAGLSPPTSDRLLRQPSLHPNFTRMTARSTGTSSLAESLNNFQIYQERFDAILTRPPE